MDSGKCQYCSDDIRKEAENHDVDEAVIESLLEEKICCYCYEMKDAHDEAKGPHFGSWSSNQPYTDI